MKRRKLSKNGMGRPEKMAVMAATCGISAGGGCAAMWKTAGRGFCEYVRHEVELARRIFDRVSAVRPESFALLVSREFYEQLNDLLGYGGAE